jgi:hypothetical protein
MTKTELAELAERASDLIADTMGPFLCAAIPICWGITAAESSPSIFPPWLRYVAVAVFGIGIARSAYRGKSKSNRITGG